ncbi:hypothetical protein Tco_0958096, partial [Tanacetum coccineum]
MTTLSTAEEKISKKNDVKARGLLLMALPNEHQLTFSQYPDAKSMFAAIETRFGGFRSINVLHQDLEQIHEDDLEAMDLKWSSLLLRSGVVQCHKVGTLPGNAVHQESKEDSEVYTDKTCSKTCLNNYETLKKQYYDLLAKQHQTKFEATTYKRGLDTVEVQLVTYRKNEVLFSEEVAVLKREVGIKQYEINMLKTEFEKVKQEKDGIEFKIEKFDKASKDLDQLLESQITDKSKKGLGYSAVPPPHPLIYNRPNKLVLSYSGLDEFKEPEFKGYGPENSKKESNVVCEKESDNSKENSDKSLVSDDEEQDESKTKPEKKTIIPTAAKIEKPVKKLVRTPVNTVRPKIVNTARSYRTPVNTVRPRVVNTARSNRTSVNAARANRFNAVKPSA